MTWALECGACGCGADLHLATLCPECAKPLLAIYPLAKLDGAGLRRRWETRAPGPWRYREIMPIREHEQPVTLGEGATPLIPVEPGGELAGLDVLVKDEGMNPTGSFKDRGMGAAVTRASLDGVDHFTAPSAGNAGAALAAFAARAAAKAHLFVPSDIPEGVLRRCRHYGATWDAVDGLIDECGRRSAEYSAETGAFNVSTLKEPYRIEGKKTMMLEIAQALGWRLPDAIVYPTGGGTGLIGSHKAASELRALGLVSGNCRLYSVQAAGCAPIVDAWNAGASAASAWADAHTEAWGLRVPSAIGDFLMLRAIRESGGGAIAVDDGSMREGARELGSLGVGAAIEGGAAMVAARRLAARGELKTGETVVLFNTAHLLTY